MKLIQGVTLGVISLLAAGCTTEFLKGGGAGAAAGVIGTGAGYELQARKQMAKLDEDLNAGRINQHDYETRKDQIQKGSIFY